ncbi:MAG: hypothetical protein A2918_03545 [Candidatus Yanofskybacteria bacterium RIFCSPLOWO2_01_FULL_42_49]|uniref:Uncharacterized protein n=1 Tax=Candidatus Yanofskybacteria bacterium RIFCSPLOWO2_01_FULL_42_49 TaxID=1802694 RepID=A0A1F8GCG7_9BACT|nr:MAG: hypothetical protein A2918_03545 [Candidatus Yanofskybacteria bacterium RIFCSPLOWO2_01_FULL_42_49]
MDCGRNKSKIEPPEDFLRETYLHCKERHPSRCYGMWTWIRGLLVKCQGCGYIMRINPKTGRLEHLTSIKKAVAECLAVRQYGLSDKP